MCPGRLAVSSAQVTAWFPQLTDTMLRQTTWPGTDQHHKYVRLRCVGRGTSVDERAPVKINLSGVIRLVQGSVFTPPMLINDSETGRTRLDNAP
jgi:hypothetical protein